MTLKWKIAELGLAAHSLKKKPKSNSSWMPFSTKSILIPTQILANLLKIRRFKLWDLKNSLVRTVLNDILLRNDNQYSQTSERQEEGKKIVIKRITQFY